MSNKVAGNLNSAEKSELEGLCGRLQLSFDDLSLLRQALTLRSWVNEHSESGWSCNQRLEFLGDAVLGMMMAEILFHRFPQVDEGGLTKMRSSLVSRPALAQVAKDWSLGEQLFVGSGDERSGARQRESTLSDAVEAILAALFLDLARQGRSLLPELRRAVEVLWGPQLAQVRAEMASDPRSQLQEKVQDQCRTTPRYRYEKAGGGELRCEVYILLQDQSEELLGSARAKHRKTAAERAARDALQEARWNPRR